MPEETPAFLPSAYKHGVTEAEMLHAVRNAIRYSEGRHELTMVVGDGGRGRLIEVGIAVRSGTMTFVHAMPARRSYLRRKR